VLDTLVNVDGSRPPVLFRAFRPEQEDKQRIALLRIASESRQERFLAAYRACGVISKAAEAAGIDRTTHYHWLRNFREASAASPIILALNNRSGTIGSALFNPNSFNFNPIP
jgi:hypothetical protein